MYVTDKFGNPYLINPQGGGGETVVLTSPQNTINISGYQIDVNPEILNSIITAHNSFPDLQGGAAGEYFHLDTEEHEYVVDMVENDSIGNLYDLINMLATPPSYNNPTSTLTGTSGTYEIGSPLAVNITQVFIQNDGGGKQSEVIRKNGTVVSSTDTFSENLTIPSGNTVYSGEVNFGQGACKDNNLGIEDCTGRIEAGATTSPNRTITGIYPVFVYKSTSPITAEDMQTAISSGQATKTVIPSTGTITVVYAPSSEYVAVAYPASSTTKTKWYVNALSQGNIPGGVFGSATTLSVNSPQGYWSTNYKIHVTPILNNPTAPTIELRNI